MDYTMIPRDPLYKRFQQVKIYICGEKTQWIIEIDYRKKVGEIILDLGKQLTNDNMFDYRLLMRYEGKERILDQD